MTKAKLGKKIETLRKAKGISTYKLRQLGVHPNTSLSIEKGKTNYTIDTLIAYLDIIGVEIEIK